MYAEDRDDLCEHNQTNTLGPTYFTRTPTKNEKQNKETYRVRWVLIPSLRITNPLTWNLSPTYALLLVLGFASFFRLLQLFSFSAFGNNKKFGPYKRKIIF